MNLKKRYFMSIHESAEPKIVLGVSGLYQSAPALTRTDDAVGMTWTMSNNEIISDFDLVFPYNKMQRETIDGNVMVYVPEMYWRFGKDSNGYITDVAVSNYPFTAGTNEVVGHTDAFYYGAYGGSLDGTKLVSKSGVSREYNKTRADSRTETTNNGANYILIDVVHTRLLQMLWLIEFATKNSESVMYGYANYGGTTGATDTLTKPSGQLANKGRMRWHYIEDFIGNGYEWVDGITGHYATANPNQYGDTQVGIAFSGTLIDNNINLLALQSIDNDNPLLIVPAQGQTNNNYNTYFCDCFRCDTGVKVYYGGTSAEWSGCGLFCLFSIASSGVDVSIGSRIMKHVS